MPFFTFSLAQRPRDDRARTDTTTCSGPKLVWQAQAGALATTPSRRDLTGVHIVSTLRLPTRALRAGFASPTVKTRRCDHTIANTTTADQQPSPDKNQRRL